MATAAALTLRYSKARSGETHPVRATPVGGETRLLDACRADEEQVRRLLITQENVT